jgi:bifunctional DNase/RNase
MQCRDCRENAILHITEVRRPSTIEELHFCEAHARQFMETQPWPAPGPDWGLPATKRAPAGVVPAAALVGFCERPHSQPPPSALASPEVQVAVVRVIISEIHQQQVVCLREVGGGRGFSSMCGIFEATALDRVLKAIPSPRPLTHDAWANTVAALGGEVQGVCVSDLREHVYSAEVRVRQGGRLVSVDVRPSDAFILALKCHTPILVAERVLAEVAWPGT